MRRRRTRKISWKKKSRKSRKKRSKRKRVSWFWHSRCLQAKQCQWGWCKMRRMITQRTMLLCWCSVHWCGLALWNTRHKIQRWYFTAPLHDIMKYDTQNTKMVLYCLLNLWNDNVVVMMQCPTPQAMLWLAPVPEVDKQLATCKACYGNWQSKIWDKCTIRDK